MLYALKPEPALSREVHCHRSHVVDLLLPPTQSLSCCPGGWRLRGLRVRGWGGREQAEEKCRESPGQRQGHRRQWVSVCWRFLPVQQCPSQELHLHGSHDHSGCGSQVNTNISNIYPPKVKIWQCYLKIFQFHPLFLLWVAGSHWEVHEGSSKSSKSTWSTLTDWLLFIFFLSD